MLELINSDCVEELRNIPDNSIDSIVTDPPYNLNFMGKDWDNYKTPKGFESWVNMWAKECFRILKPGGHILAFGGTRTYHRLAAGIEDAGFEIRDQIQWIYGSGFPKSTNVSKQIEKAYNKELKYGAEKKGVGSNNTESLGVYNNTYTDLELQLEESKQWEGWGTALKPANEPIVMGRKPFDGPLYKNILENGVGGINIDDCRVQILEGDGVPVFLFKGNKSAGIYGDGLNGTINTGEIDSTTGRWPANIILDEEASELLGEQSRFFYSAKASKKEKNFGLTKEVENDRFQTRQCTICERNVPYVGSCGCEGAEIRMVSPKPTKNAHPTVKPIDLMRYLIRLVTPPNGIVLDPFLGSGTTGIAAHLEGFNFIGIEKDQEYFELAKERINHWNQFEGDTKEILKKNG